MFPVPAAGVLSHDVALATFYNNRFADEFNGLPVTTYNGVPVATTYNGVPVTNYNGVPVTAYGGVPVTTYNAQFEDGSVFGYSVGPVPHAHPAHVGFLLSRFHGNVGSSFGEATVSKVHNE